MTEKTMPMLRFDGSLWCNMDIALRNLDQVISREVRSYGLSIIELYILRALYERDGQNASELANEVGRAATSFTPNLDKLQAKGYIARHNDERDRRAVRIHLTPFAEERRAELTKVMQRIDQRLCAVVPMEDYEAFLRVLAVLQSNDLG
ncbi:MAG: MarR family transcriptional regulator [Anaerolineae bacterium]